MVPWGCFIRICVREPLWEDGTRYEKEEDLLIFKPKFNGSRDRQTIYIFIIIAFRQRKILIVAVYIFTGMKHRQNCFDYSGEIQF